MKSFIRTRSSVSFFTALALLLATNGPVLVSSRLNGRGTGGRITAASPTYKVSFDASKSSYAVCPAGALATTLTNRTTNKPLVNKRVTIVLSTKATSTTPSKVVLRQAVRTNAYGKALISYTLTSPQMQQYSGMQLKCIIKIDNAAISGGYQVVNCPKVAQLCSVPDCADTAGPVICQGDMAFDDLCTAVNTYGMYTDECVPEDNVPDCQQVAGYVLCNNEYFDTYCKATMAGYSMASGCQQVDDAAVPPEAKTGEVVCTNTVVYTNMWAALANGEKEGDCWPTGH